MEEVNQNDVQSQQMLRGDEKPEQLSEKINWESVDQYELENENGSKILFADVYKGVQTIVIFIRVSQIDHICVC